MNATRNFTTLERRYDKLGARVTKVVATVEGYVIAEGFQCHSCGACFVPAAERIRNRHRCPNNCNAAKTL